MTPTEFDATPALEEPAARQGVRPARDLESLLGPPSPEDEESIDDFLMLLREWRAAKASSLHVNERGARRYGCCLNPVQTRFAAELYEAHLAGRLLGISFMSLAELERWTLERNWGPLRKSELVEFLEKFVAPPASRELRRKWAEETFAARRYGQPIQTADAGIAATALPYQVPLITRNRADYETVPTTKWLEGLN